MGSTALLKSTLLIALTILLGGAWYSLVQQEFDSSAWKRNGSVRSRSAMVDDLLADTAADTALVGLSEPELFERLGPPDTATYTAGVVQAHLWQLGRSPISYLYCFVDEAGSCSDARVVVGE